MDKKYFFIWFCNEPSSQLFQFCLINKGNIFLKMECFMIHHTGYQQQKSYQIEDGFDQTLHMISLNNQLSYNPGVI